MEGAMNSSPINPNQDLSWLDDAACADRSWTEFFVEAGHTISPEVLTLCGGCPVRVDCLKHAYDNDHRSGYFGGMSPGARKSMTFEQAERYARTGRKPGQRTSKGA
jgi:WhiB family transcriptional regulator, redox-sensing transcriptional regulator